MKGLNNFYQVSDQLNCSGQPTEKQLQEVADEGFKVVINLGLDGQKYSLPEEREKVIAMGMNYHHIPVMFDNPTEENLFQFIETIESYEGKKVYVHCAANYRASSFIGLYLFWKDRLDEGSVYDFILNIWTPDQVWQPFIDSCIEKIKEGK